VTQDYGDQSANLYMAFRCQEKKISYGSENE
jgi:hypothetical protein